MGKKRKPAMIIQYDASGCNGCGMEFLSCLSPVYDIERLGFTQAASPKHADIFLITGAVNQKNAMVLRRIYRQIPEPKVVIAAGACASSGGIFRDCEDVLGGADAVIPVDVYLTGCAPRPELLIDGLLKGVSLLDAKRIQWKKRVASGEAPQHAEEEEEEIEVKLYGFKEEDQDE